jgi:glutaredoxin 3
MKRDLSLVMATPRKSPSRALASSLAALGLWGCTAAAPPAPPKGVEATSLPKITVGEKTKLLLTYAGEGGKFDTVDTIAKVPAAGRGFVRVVDLAQKPDRRLDHELVYVADLRAPGKDGLYPYIVMSREAFEASAISRPGQGATDPPRPPAGTGAVAGAAGGVILYATSWCPACKSAREYMTANGIPYVEKDIEKDPAAAAELLEKAKKAGVSASGVPVLDVGGTLMQGFDAERLRALLGALPTTKKK